jgi:hypothetical protein
MDDSAHGRGRDDRRCSFSAFTRLLSDVESLMLLDNPFSLDSRMTGNDGEVTLLSTDRSVFLEGQLHTALAERVRALAQEGHPLGFSHAILHGFAQDLVAVAEQHLVLGP